MFRGKSYSFLLTVPFLCQQVNGLLRDANVATNKIRCHTQEIQSLSTQASCRPT